MSTDARLRAISRLVYQVPRPSRTATHDEDCWTRHTGCLAVRIRAVLEDPAPGHHDSMPHDTPGAVL